MATIYSGKYGQVDFGASTYGEATSWELTVTADNEQYGAFGSGGYKRAIAGNLSGSGTVSGKQDFNVPIESKVMAGDSITLKLYDTTTGSGALADRYWSIPVVVTDISPSVDGDGGGAVGWTVSFVSNGTITKPT